jgi:uncharacterized protein (DUF305 family)
MIGMTLPHRRSVTSLVVTTVALAACSSAMRRTTETADGAVARHEADSAAVAKAKTDSARYPYTAADIEFMSNMIGHHAQAIVIAQWAPTHGASPSIQTLAGRIINAQNDEIAIMQRWLRDRQLPVPDPTASGTKMIMGGMEHEMLMPGMLTPDQMKQLDEARGKEFDRLFLTLMIQHHRGAVTMVDELFSSYGAGLDETVFKFASDVNTDQSTEIDRMQLMLADLMFGNPSP